MQIVILQSDKQVELEMFGADMLSRMSEPERRRLRLCMLPIYKKTL